MDPKAQHARADSYRLLAACLYPPDTFWQDREQLFVDLAAALRPCSSEAADFAESMGTSIAQRRSEHELSVEHAKLFVGPYELLAPPYGSVYLDEGKRVMGNSTIAVKQMYQEYGLKLADDFKELPDHIAVELEFMYYLIYKMLEAEQQADNAAGERYAAGQRQFLKIHLSPFVAALCARIDAGTASNFYKSLSACLCAFITADSQPVST